MSDKYALIIGNTEYTDPGLAQLSAPGKDAKDLACVLRDKEIGSFEDVNILLNQPEYVVREAIDRFFDQKKPDDLLVLYFSGHGVRDELGALYLAVKNTIRTRLRSTAIKSDYIREAMDQSRSKRQVLILDCCNSGAFAPGTKAATGASIGTATAFDSGYGRIILTASDSTQFAWEGDKVIGNTDNSLFTHYLVEGLKGAADLDGDGRITVDELYDYAYEKVRLATPKQTPSKFSNKQQGEIVLRQSTREENIKPQPLPAELMEEIEDTRPYVREAAVQKLEKILKGKNIGLAHSAREALKKVAADENTTRRVAQSAKQALESFPLIEKKAKEENQPFAAQKLEQKKIDVAAKETKGASVVAKPESKKSQKTPMWGIGLLALAIISLCSWGVFKIGPRLFAPSPTQALVETPLPAETSAIPETSTPSPTETSIPTPPLGIGSTMIGNDGAIVVYVPAGEFIMGSDSDTDEQPIHTVYLDAFWIDQTEVTNAMYAKCMSAGACQPPLGNSSSTRSSYYGNSEFNDYPVIYVDWDQAKSYCAWAGRRLPTEAQWEKAASWDDQTKTKRVYPWGDSIDCTFANYSDAKGICTSDTTKVGIYLSGASFYNVYDMTGNVWEWVNDWYGKNYYQSSPVSNPLGPDSGQFHVVRGSSWYDGYGVRSAFRGQFESDFGHILGFRCAVSP
jgi:formylglycine-generating enzyme required for sulfatase activity/uncharacterized caspase-like protein